MSVLQNLETKLNDLLVKKAPYQIPDNGRKNIAGALWWITLVFGILQLWLAWGFWHLGHAVNQIVDYTNALQRAYGVPAAVSVQAQHLGMAYYLALLMLALDGVILLLATSGLKAKQKSGWNLLYYSVLLNAVYGLVRVFSSVGGGIGALISVAISSLLGAYVLFQVREYFMGKHAAAAEHAVAEHPKKDTPAKEDKE
ncbi:MAG TPA: hypothetical protein VLF91_00255 [Candidatus Saccharimonadales bacterium]|nr:hypothetical protein [Candidatus Saccharimonadales bacterium]